MNKDKIAIIDLDSILFAAAWGKKIPLPNGDFERDEKGRLVYIDKTEPEIAGSIDAMMNSILIETNSTKYISYVKGKNTGAHRYAAKSDYKSNRPKQSPDWWEFAKNYSIKNWKTVIVNDIEVDDAVNITRLNLKDSFIIAIDKDLLHLEGTHYNWRTQEWNTVSKSEEEYYFWSDMIVGQPGDGVKGLPGKGEAHARKALKDVSLLASTVFSEYLDTYKDGIIAAKEYVSNYECLKILEAYEGFEIPEPISYTYEFDEGEIEDLFKD